MNKTIQNIAHDVLSGVLLKRKQADQLARRSREVPYELLYWANEIRSQYFGNQVQVCSIAPGRLGGCDQDCKFCAQSVHYETAVQDVQVLSNEEILQAAAEAYEKGVRHFGIVYSGKRISEPELDRVADLIGEIKARYRMTVCGSLGIITPEQAGTLASAGLDRYNHNVETSAKHFGTIVSTHNYKDRVNTIESVRKVGLKICAGGIFGVGENETDRIDMAFELRELGADDVPLNFLHPIEGTPLAQQETLAPMEILRIIALYRFLLPSTTLKVAGGRVRNLRDVQSWIFYAGCNSIISGNYLTTAGRAVEDDLQMLADLNLEAI